MAGLNRVIGFVGRAIVDSPSPPTPLLTSSVDGLHREARAATECAASFSVIRGITGLAWEHCQLGMWATDHDHPLLITGGWFERAGFVAAEVSNRGSYVGRGIKPKE